MLLGKAAFRRRAFALQKTATKHRSALTLQKRVRIILLSLGWGLASTEVLVRLTKVGRIAREQLLRLPERFATVRIDKYVIMPTHIHAIVVIEREVVGARPHPTLMDIVGAYKSMTTRECNRVFDAPGKNLFQRSFYETVLRNERAYLECWRYIDENPRKWMLNPEDT